MVFRIQLKRGLITAPLILITYSYLVGHLHHLLLDFQSFLPASDTELETFRTPVKNVATGKTATQSSTLRDFGAFRAIDGNARTFSHTNDDNAWLEINLGDMYPISYVAIDNRWCMSPSDLPGCLCRLSGIKLSLIDNRESLVATESIGNACHLKEVTVEFDADANCATPTKSHQGTPNCLPVAKKLKLHSTTGQPIHVFEVRIFSPNISNDKQYAVQNKTIQNKEGISIAFEGHPHSDPETAEVSIERIEVIHANNTSSNGKPSSKLFHSVQNVSSQITGKGLNHPMNFRVDLKPDLENTTQQVHKQFEEPRAGSSIQNNGNILQYSKHKLTASHADKHWEPVLLTEKMLNSGLRFFVFKFIPWAGLGSNLMNLFSQVMYLGETYSRFPIAFLGNYGYRRNATLGLLSGFFSPGFPVLDQQELPALVERYRGNNENSTVWLTVPNTYRMEIQKIYDRQPEVLFKKMVHYSCPHLMFNNEAKGEIKKVRRDHGIDFDFGGSNLTSVAFHVRRTDKKKEVEPTAASEYVDTFLKVFVNMDQIPEVHHCYIATDDFSAVEEVKTALIRASISCNVHSIQTGVLNRNNRENFVNTINLMTELSILQEATYFVGSFTSNIGDLVAVLRGCAHSEQTHFAHSYDVNGGSFRLY